MTPQKSMKKMSGSDRGWFEPDLCESRYPIWTRARTGNRFARVLQTIEMIVTFGGCPCGRGREEKYGVKPNERVPTGAK
jgi:hypothetical protein